MHAQRDPLGKTALQGAAGILGLAALGATAYQIVRDNGLYRLASDIQVFILTYDYYPFISFLATLFVCGLPAIGVWQLADHLYGVNKPLDLPSASRPDDLFNIDVVHIPDADPPAPPREEPPADPPLPTPPAAPVPPKPPPRHPGPPFFPS